MTDPISIANRALAQAGAREQIVNFDEGSVAAINCSLLYQSTFEQLARAAYWNALRYQDRLTLLKAAQGTPENQDGTVLPIPPQPWRYEYSLPSDCLAVRFLQPTFINPPAGTVPIFPTPSSFVNTLQARTEIPFVVGSDKVKGQLTKVILTNLSMAQIVYTLNNPNPNYWDSQFQAAYVASLAAFLIPPLNLNMALLGKQIEIAGNIIAQARTADGNESVQVQNREAEWIVARGAGEYIGNGYGGGYPMYFEMSWPLGS